MAKSGVETVRVAFRWFQLQPAAGAYDLRVSDDAVAAAVARGMQVLPVIEQTPGWAATRPGDLAAAPRDPATAQAFAAVLVARYGPSGLVLGRASRAAEAADPRVAGVQRAEPLGLLVRGAVRAELRRHAARGRRRHPHRRPGRDDRARRPHEPQLARAAPALQVRRARPVRRRRPAPVHAPGGGRAEARALRPPGHGQARRRRPPGVDHRAELAGGAGPRARRPRHRDRGQRARAGDAARPGVAAARPRPQARADREGPLVHVALERQGPEPVRLVRPAAAAQGRRRVDPGPAGVPDRGAQARGLPQERPATPAAAPSRPRARPRPRRARSRPS